MVSIMNNTKLANISEQTKNKLRDGIWTVFELTQKLSLFFLINT